MRQRTDASENLMFILAIGPRSMERQLCASCLSIVVDKDDRGMRLLTNLRSTLERFELNEE
jgi:hypothetical protein